MARRKQNRYRVYVELSGARDYKYINKAIDDEEAQAQFESEIGSDWVYATCWRIEGDREEYICAHDGQGDTELCKRCGRNYFPHLGELQEGHCKECLKEMAEDRAEEVT